MLLALCMVLSLVPVTAFAADPTVIDRVDFTFADLSYQAGETPKKMASVTGSNAHYTIYDEYIKEVKDKPGRPMLLFRRDTTGIPIHLKWLGLIPTNK